MLITASSAWAKTPMRWDDLLQKVYAQNEELKSLEYQKESVRHLKDASKSDFLPSLYLFADKRNQNREIGYLTNDQNSEAYGFKASWNLFNGFSTFNTVAKFSAQEQQSLARIREQKAEVRYSLRRALFRILISQRAIQTWEKLLALQKNQLAVVQIKYRNGVEAQWSVELSEANVELTKATLEAERQVYIANFAEIEAILGENLPGDVVWIDDIDQYLTDNREYKLREDHPRLIYLRELVKEAHRDLSIQGAAYLPQIQANFQSGKIHPQGEETINDRQWSLSVTVPIFEGLNTWNRRSQARAFKIAREHEYKNSLNFLVKNLEKAQSLLKANKTVLRAKSAEVKAAQIWSRTVEKQYRLGVRKYYEWDQAQTKLISSERDYLNLLRDTLDSRISLERLLAETEGL